MNDNPIVTGAQATGPSITSFIMGAVAGAALALLLAPEKGADTRHRLASAARRIGRHARETANELAHDAHDALEAGQRGFQERPKNRMGT